MSQPVRSRFSGATRFPSTTGISHRVGAASASARNNSHPGFNLSSSDDSDSDSSASIGNTQAVGNSSTTTSDDVFGDRKDDFKYDNVPEHFEADEEAKPRKVPWDRAKLVPDPDLGHVESPLTMFLLKLGKIVTGFFVLLCVSFGAAISLLFFELASAGSNCSGKDFNITISLYQMMHRWPCITDALIANLTDSTTKLSFQSSNIPEFSDISVTFGVLFNESNSLKWYWCMFFMLIVPQFTALLWAIMRLSFGSSKQPSLSYYFLAITSQGLNSIGTTLFAYIALPSTGMGVINGTLFTCSVAWVPALLNMLSKNKKSARPWLVRILNFLAFFGQSTVFIHQAIASRVFGVEKFDSSLSVWLCVSLILVSCGYWENFITPDNTFLTQKAKDFIKNYRKVGPSSYPRTIMVTSLTNCACILITMGAILFYRGNFHTVFTPSAFYEHNSTIDIIQCVGCEQFLQASQVNLPVVELSSLNLAVANITTTTIAPVYTPLVLPSQISCPLTVQAAWVVASSQILASFVSYFGSLYALKIMLEKTGFAFPLSFCAPIILVIAYILMHTSFLIKVVDYGLLHLHMPPETLWKVQIQQDTSSDWITTVITSDAYIIIFWVTWFLSGVWLTRYAWYPPNARLAKAEKLFTTMSYSPVFINQGLLFNRRDPSTEERDTEQTVIEARAKGEQENPEASTEDPEDGTRFSTISTVSGQDDEIYPMIYVCATMWHENLQEMRAILRSIFRMDRYQSRKQIIREEFPQFFPAIKKEYFQFETHVMFDDAFLPTRDDTSPLIGNSFVKLLLDTIDQSASEAYQQQIKLTPPKRYSTPYGAQLVWDMCGVSRNKLVVHLKCKSLIRHRKRWSQVMYMYYLLQYKLYNQHAHLHSTRDREKLEKFRKIKHNTHILTLDGDVDFQPEAVIRLLDLMNTSLKIGSVCGRIHPLGKGPVVWYQKFEYAIGHWLQKAAEHVFGCVLCSPGCFALFRGSAVMDENIMRMYTEKPEVAMDFLQRDQGEDRWLCTLMLKQGHRIEYSAAADAYTFAPEGFDEFWKQRRRWTPSTIANLIDLLGDKDKVVRQNVNMSTVYMWYQMFMMASTILGPGAIIIMLFGSFNTVFGVEVMTSLIANCSAIGVFCLVCTFMKEKYQIQLGYLMSIAYGVLMAAVAIGLALQARTEGLSSPNTLFLLLLITMFIIAGVLHPYEISCLMWGIIYFLTVPSAYLLLQIYSANNIDNVSWGTREVKQLTPEGEDPEPVQAATAPADNTLGARILSKLPFSTSPGSLSFSIASLCRCVCMPYPETPRSQIEALEMQVSTVSQNVSTLVQKLDERKVNIEPDPKTKVLTSISTTRRSTPEIISSGISSLDEISEESDEDKPSTSREALPLPPTVPSTPKAKLNPLDFSEGNEMLEHKDQQFWIDLINKYLYPLDENKAEKERVSNELKELKNKSLLTLYLVNVFFIIIIFILQLQQGCLSFAWPLSAAKNRTMYMCKDGKTVKGYGYAPLMISPVELAVLSFFAVLLIVQFFGMLLHRAETWTHFMASIKLGFYGWLRTRKVKRGIEVTSGAASPEEMMNNFSAYDLENVIDVLQMGQRRVRRNSASSIGTITSFSTLTSGANSQATTDKVLRSGALGKLWQKNLRKEKRHFKKHNSLGRGAADQLNSGGKSALAFMFNYLDNKDKIHR